MQVYEKASKILYWKESMKNFNNLLGSFLQGGDLGGYPFKTFIEFSLAYFSKGNEKWEKLSDL